ncbi:acyltransferase-like protein At3g26840, chloroplastic isoform X2 [Dendrobium catenatum]|uniref:acyltransferase-like protein At3g26840, chloroplastic isoform X2 n=1 Tax=Dendrobium catenatum TaxID=906689 RepID=UPI0010A02578|nr:acyltransferase-like protein At3g26840, chloroplastic isoform X2 [Dendrobium catenatum]
MAASVFASLPSSVASVPKPKPSSRRLPTSMALASGTEPAAFGISSELKTRTKLTEGGKPLPPPTLQQDGKVFDETVVEPRGLSDFIEQSRELVRHDGGPPRWITPLDCSGPRHTNLPSLFYLPGIDGVGMGLVRHHQRLGKIFNVWCLHIPVMDRTPFKGLVEYVESTIKSGSHCLPNMPVYLVGESLGACIALAVAARNPNIDFVLILANSATCFSKSNIQYLSSFLDVIPEPMHIGIPYFLDLLTGENLRMSSTFAVDQISITQVFSGFFENLNKMLPSLFFLAEILPKESLQWKLQLLKSASSYVDPRLHTVKAQTLLLARLTKKRVKMGCDTLLDRKSGAFDDILLVGLEEESFDIVNVMKGSCYYRRSSYKDYVSDYLPPTPYEFQKISEQYRWINIAASPVMLSTLESGQIVKGLAGIPSEGPVLLVGYHMLMGFEAGPLVIRFLNEKNIHLRAVGHPFLFNRDSEMLMLDSSTYDGMRTMGVVPVSGTTLYKLLSRKSFVLLYPGGAREALHKKVLIDYNDLRKIPFYDLLDKRLNQKDFRVRANSAEEVGNQELHLPGLLPKIPGRFYYLFGKPIETKGLKKVSLDRGEAQKIYLHVKSQVENCISYLKEKREQDPFRNLLPRLLYQVSRGFTEEAPTFEL